MQYGIISCIEAGQSAISAETSGWCVLEKEDPNHLLIARTVVLRVHD